MKKTSIAKISRPNARGIIPRKRLFRLLDNARKQPVLWVTGPAGSGKTSLIAGYLDARKLPCLWYQADERDSDIAAFFYYLGLAAKKAAPRYRKPLPLLTPEYLSGLPTFTQRFFENLYSRLKPPFAVVFDNYQDVPEESLLHDVMQNALSLVPEGIQVFILSRNEPPAEFSRLRANNAIRIVGWDELRFTLEETKQFVRRKENLPEQAIEELHAKTEGWVAGLVLMSRTASRADLPEKQTAWELFDYFAGELFDKTNAETRNFLLRTAFLPILTAPMAERMSGSGQAARLLANLRRNHLFITSNAESVYQYHPLFREFLTVRACELFPKEELAAVRRLAASILKDNGRPEDAAVLFREAADWQLFIELTLEQAPVLVAEGRLQTLSGWLSAIPNPLFAGFPWLWYWLGACRVPFNPKEGLRHFEKAFDLFQQHDDTTGTLLAWSGTINAVLLCWTDFAPLDSLIAWFYERAGMPAFPSVEVEAECASSMAGAMAWRQPDHPDIGAWVERALNLTRKSQNSALKLQAYIHASYYYLWVGDISHALLVDKEMREMVRGPAVPPLTLITCKWLEADISYLATASYESGLQAVSAALETAHTYGIHVWDHMIYALGVYGALLKGDRETASEFLDKMKSILRADQSHGYCHYHYLAAWHDILFGDSSEALSHAELSLELALEIRGAGLYFPETLCRLALANILCEKKDSQRAAHELASADDAVRRSKSRIMDFMHRLTKARTALAQGDEAAGMVMLRSALELGRSQNFINMLYWWQPTVMAALCERALEGGIEVDYVQNLVRKRNLFPERPPLDIDNWPWPLKIITLGGFSLLIDGKPVAARRKAQHKPLLLLKALIAFGGSEVPEEKITDLLWPDSEGDAAHSAFSTTLQRLRALVGNDEALLLNERRLSLDHRFCSVDAWSFERMHERAESLWRTANDQSGRERESIAADAFLHGEKALALYQGYFLPGDSGQAWTAAYRERLRIKFLRLVLQQGLYLEESAQWRKAAETFEQGLATDEFAEEFYQHLMICYQRLEQTAKAIRVYENCRAVFSFALGIAPSSQTEALHSSLLK